MAVVTTGQDILIFSPETAGLAAADAAAGPLAAGLLAATEGLALAAFALAAGLAEALAGAATLAGAALLAAGGLAEPPQAARASEISAGSQVIDLVRGLLTRGIVREPGAAAGVRISA
ncbi:MAG TPA: hypothetical protein VK009_21040 [Chloroflexota bacterium]|nr:hypothetical protein [Chloroflexota bacterium]